MQSGVAWTGGRKCKAAYRVLRGGQRRQHKGFCVEPRAAREALWGRRGKAQVLGWGVLGGGLRGHGDELAGAADRLEWGQRERELGGLHSFPGHPAGQDGAAETRGEGTRAPGVRGWRSCGLAGGVVLSSGRGCTGDTGGSPGSLLFPVSRWVYSDSSACTGLGPQHCQGEGCVRMSRAGLQAAATRDGD